MQFFQARDAGGVYLIIRASQCFNPEPFPLSCFYLRQSFAASCRLGRFAQDIEGGLIVTAYISRKEGSGTTLAKARKKTIS